MMLKSRPVIMIQVTIIQMAQSDPMFRSRRNAQKLGEQPLYAPAQDLSTEVLHALPAHLQAKADLYLTQLEDRCHMRHGSRTGQIRTVV